MAFPGAVKIPLCPLVELPDRQKERERESLEVARHMVGHPHSVGLVRYEWVGDCLITVWDWAEGGSLEDMLRHYQQQGISAAGQAGHPARETFGLPGRSGQRD
jgi:hypothetical protein